MRVPSVALLAAVLLATPVLAVEIVELKSGKVLEAEKVTLNGDKLRIALHRPQGDQTIEFSIPIKKVVPEFVFYVWAGQIDDDDSAEMLQLAAWSRGQGLFRLAWRTYERAAAVDAEIKAKLPDLRRELYKEEAAWLLEDAWRLFREGEVKAARVRTEKLLDHFADSAEVGKAKGLLNIIKEREQFLSEQKKQEEIAKRARKQKRIVDRQVAQIEKADRLVLKARLKYVVDAKRKLRYAAYVYRNAALEFADMLGYVEVDNLRLMLKALLEDLDRRLVRTFLKLGDLRYMTGDTAGALDAAHEVLAVDPDNKDAGDLRDRSLSRPARPDVATSVYYPYGYRYRYRPVYTRRYHAPHVAAVRGFGIYVPGQTTFRFRVGTYYYR